MDKYAGMYRVVIRLTNNSDSGYEQGVVGEMGFYKGEPQVGFGDYKGETQVGFGDYKGESQEGFDVVEYEPLYRVRESDYNYKGDYKSDYNYNRNRNRYGSQIVVYESTRGGGRRFWRGALLRLVVSALLFFAVFGMSKMDSPIFKKATEVIKAAITYDLDKNEDKKLGEINALKLIEEIQEEKNAEEE